MSLLDFRLLFSCLLRLFFLLSLLYYLQPCVLFFSFFFFFNDTAPPEIYPLPLHDALPISVHLLLRDRHELQERFVRHPHVALGMVGRDLALVGEEDLHRPPRHRRAVRGGGVGEPRVERDRKSTRLNSSHTVISYAVFCLKK